MRDKPQTPCSTCYGWSWGCNGYVPQDGTGDSGVLLIAESAGADESEQGVPLVGQAGQYLWSQLQRIGVSREGFRLHNVLSCRPFKNLLSKMPYEQEVIKHCSPLLDATIAEHVQHCKDIGKTPVIVTLGRIAFKRIMDLEEKRDHALLKEDFLCYPFWHDKYQCFVIGAQHPSFLMRGQSRLVPVLQFAVRRALEIADTGLKLDNYKYYLLDPDPQTFAQWVQDYEHYALANPDTFLSFDIETPYKRGKDESDIVEVEDEDYTILRVSFCYQPGMAVSVPWSAENLPYLEEIFSFPGAKIGWNCPTPDQRILTADLKWVKAGDLRVGDRLVGLTENVPEGHRLRKYKTTTVTHATCGKTRVFEVKLSDGSSVKVSENHPWLLAQRNRTKGHRKVGGSAWVQTKDLIVGQSVQRLFDTWEEDNSREAGYLAGFFDGEGYISVDPTKVGGAQNKGPTLDRVLSLLDEKHFKNRGSSPSRLKDAHCVNFVIPNGINGSARFLGQIRPLRLLNKFKPEHLGAVWHLNTSKLRILAIRDLGEQEIVKLSTTAHTYILEGFAAHNSESYDIPRITAKMPVHGERHDAMLCWHVLNSALDKGLGFVTPFYGQTMPMWKHLSQSKPALYNAIDADAALQNFLGIRKDLIANGQWAIYEKHVVRLNKVLGYMSEKGVLLDKEGRAIAEKQLQDLLDVVELKMEAAVPKQVRKEKVYKKAPKKMEGVLIRLVTLPVKVCPKCELVNPKKDHFKVFKKKVNNCGGLEPAVIEAVGEQFYKELPFKVSKQSLLSYQGTLRHQAIINRRENKVTFDESAMVRLMKKYPNDPLYPLILQYRELGKLLGTYIGVTQPGGKIKGGMPADKDGAVRTFFTHNPSTLRLASQNPNLQNIPRSGSADDLCSIIRNLFVAREGHIFQARDFSGIEAVLVGYFAADPTYIRLAKIDVHSFYTAYALNQLDGRIQSADLPLISWPNEKLIPHLAAIKKEFKRDRNELYKHLIHGANFMQGPKGAQEKIFKETRIEFPIKKISTVMGIYFELFPAIKRWHHDLLLQAEKNGFLRNPFGYVHRFSRVFDYKKEFGSWQKEPGADANRVIAFLPQSTAAGIIKEAIFRLYFNRFEEAGQYMRLQIHDEVFCEAPIELADQVDAVLKEEMEKVIPEMALPKSYNMGPYLSIDTEGKRGNRWGSMH